MIKDCYKNKTLDCSKPALAFHLAFFLFYSAVSDSWRTGSGCCYCLSYLAGTCRTFILSCQTGILVRFITCIKQRGLFSLQENGLLSVSWPMSPIRQHLRLANRQKLRIRIFITSYCSLLFLSPLPGKWQKFGI